VTMCIFLSVNKTDMIKSKFFENLSLTILTIRGHDPYKCQNPLKQKLKVGLCQYFRQRSNVLVYTFVLLKLLSNRLDGAIVNKTVVYVCNNIPVQSSVSIPNPNPRTCTFCHNCCVQVYCTVLQLWYSYTD
jgi:hypothetical protein